MATYVLIHGGGGGAWDWHLVAPELEQRGHEVVAIDLPTDDSSKGFGDYADVLAEAVGQRRGLVVVGQSFGAFTAPLVCERVPVDLLVYLAGMVPRPGEAPGDWWANTGYAEARRAAFGADVDMEREEGLIDAFMHDVPRQLALDALHHPRDTSGIPMGEPLPFDAHPDVPTRAIVCRDDRFLPAGWLRGVVRERLGVDADEVEGSHCVYLSRPRELANRLEVLRRMAVP